MIQFLRKLSTTMGVVFALAACASSSMRCQAQAAVLMEEPYGFFGLLNPTGHSAVYFARICAESTYKVRRCEPGELGSVLARYQGMNHHDWAAVPLIPYLYAVDDLADVPAQVSAEQVQQMRADYRQFKRPDLDPLIRPGNIVRGGWKHLFGVVYDRRIFAYRFETSEAEDDALIEKLNTSPNVSHFNLFYMNCADFTRSVLNHYFPGKFKRLLFPDAGVGTPKQTNSRFLRFAQKHPELHMTVYEIPQIPGFRRPSRRNKGISESLVTTTYLAPLYFINPYLPAAIAVHYLIHCRFGLHRTHPLALPPEQLAAFAGAPALAPASSLAVTTPSAPAVPPEPAASISVSKPE